MRTLGLTRPALRRLHRPAPNRWLRPPGNPAPPTTGNQTLRVYPADDGLRLSDLRALARAATTAGPGLLDLTGADSGSPTALTLHFTALPLSALEPIRSRLVDAGVRVERPGRAAPRTVIGSPAASVAADELVDGTPAVREITHRYLGDPSLAVLPRQFLSSISGSPRQDVGHEGHDVAFVGVDHPDHGPGFDLWVGSGRPEPVKVARRLGVFVPVEEVAEVWFGVARVFRDYGSAPGRGSGRALPSAAVWTPDRFRRVLEAEYLGRSLSEGPAPVAPPHGRRDHLGVNRQRRGGFYLTARSRSGRLDGPGLYRLADLVQAAGAHRVRITQDGHVMILDLPTGAVRPALGHVDRLGLQVPRHRSPERNGDLRMALHTQPPLHTK